MTDMKTADTKPAETAETTTRDTRANGEGTSVVARPDQAPTVEAVDVPALLDHGRTLCTPVLREAVARLAPPMDAVSAYHFGWTDAQGNPTNADSGKAVRPALALLSARAAGAPAAVGVPGGVAVELVHNFSLLHDDLMDRDETRRHRATVWTVFGPAQAILVGDAMFALANEILLEAPGLGTTSPVDAGRAVHRITVATRKLIDGQAQDLSFEQRDRVGVEECLEMEGNKTGALLAVSASVGAVLAGMDDQGADALERYGYHLGLAFQAVDDLLGIWGDTEVTGKPNFGDLRARKKSLPVCAALAEGGKASLRLAELLADPEGRGDEDEEQLAVRAALIEEAGGRAWTAEEARRQHSTALAALDEVAMPSEVRAQFAALAEFVVVRER
ncbi:polyprenyl synthetase family protein [Streptacidiphilus jiangxiensis]|uniref:Geranylgeranyl diphosphate synthase, type I n=1 Tax=Streptacidiphilus jiangxiensis TaxID=235985 RepID=A0A1H8AQE8_STRJI|nr:polyprenyl synthetase family protein [Streptacidiphilus jiangxiensis]SEM72952.1 geranylgeranyl diphosphate synthase, type I [Streptacidiphilus jiangxiensis]